MGAPPPPAPCLRHRAPAFSRTPWLTWSGTYAARAQAGDYLAQRYRAAGALAEVVSTLSRSHRKQSRRDHCADASHFASSTQMGACRDRIRKHVVPFGIDERPYQPTAALLGKAAEIRARYAGKRLVFGVGRHVYYKGFEYLIRAMSEIPDTMADYRRQWTSSAALTRDSSLNWAARRRSISSVASMTTDLPAYYHAADLYCLPSVEKSEAFGLVQLEAMACGKPVVCCQLDNGVNYVNLDGVTGFAVPPRDRAGIGAVRSNACSEMTRCGSVWVRRGGRGCMRSSRWRAWRAAPSQVYQQVLGRPIRLKVLVTGGTGFVGNALCAHLAGRGFLVRAAGSLDARGRAIRRRGGRRHWCRYRLEHGVGGCRSGGPPRRPSPHRP